MSDSKTSKAPTSAKEAHERACAAAKACSAAGRNLLAQSRRGGFKPGEDAVDYRFTGSMFD